MAAVVKMFAAVLLVVMALSGVGVSAQTHHVVGDDKGWGPDLDVGSWLSGRVFSVGDKIWFKYSGADEGIVELQGLEEFVSCNLTNPIKMYTDPVSDVPLEKEGVRYFTSANPVKCKNGLKLPVPVRSDSSPPFDPHPPFKPTPSFEPPFPVWPPPPSHHEPPPFDPQPPFKPTPSFEPPFPVRPPPPSHHEPPPSPSPAARLDVLSVVLFAGWLFCYIGI